VRDHFWSDASRRNRISGGRYQSLRSRRHAYWHYSFGLGDGVSVEASLPAAMALHEINHDIMMSLYDRHFGGVSGKTIIDVACASGYHTFGLARTGAVVTGIDFDAPSIDQARFVQQCQDDANSLSVTFVHADLFTISHESPFDLFLCSGLFYHLRDLVGGAKKLYDICRTGGVISSHVAAGESAIMELADATKYICCFEGELSFVPTANMLRKILAYVGFREIFQYKPQELCTAEKARALASHYANVFQHNLAYFAVRK
jgi:SAM-dependent methyltransferase